MLKKLIFIKVLYLYSLCCWSAGMHVSVEHLILNPDKFIDKEVRVIGFIKYEPGYPYMTLYNSKDNALLKNYPTSVSLINDLKKGRLKDYCSNIYVKVNGTVRKKEQSIFIEVEGYIQPFDDEFNLAYRTCEPTDNQIKKANNGDAKKVTD